MTPHSPTKKARVAKAKAKLASLTKTSIENGNSADKHKKQRKTFIKIEKGDLQEKVGESGLLDK